MEVWEQQDGEHDSAYAAFTIYRGLLAPRQLSTAYRLWKRNPKARLSGTWHDWFHKFQWASRAVAYDKRLDAVRRAVQEKVVAEVQAEYTRTLELSNLSILKETSALALSRITDVVEWDETGRVTRVIPSKDLPDHAAAAISKLTVVHDKNGNPNMQIEMHPKVRPIDLAGQNLSLWEDAKEQAQKIQTNAFLDFLTFIKSGGLRDIPHEGPRPSLRNPPPWITIDGEVVGEKKP